MEIRADINAKPRPFVEDPGGPPAAVAPDRVADGGEPQAVEGAGRPPGEVRVVGPGPVPDGESLRVPFGRDRDRETDRGAEVAPGPQRLGPDLVIAGVQGRRVQLVTCQGVAD